MSKEKRQAYLAEINNYYSKKIVHVDESGMNDTDFWLKISPVKILEANEFHTIAVTALMTLTDIELRVIIFK